GYLDHGPAAPGWLEEVESKRARPPREERNLAGRLRLLALEPADLGQLRLCLPRLRLLVAEPLDEALEPCDVRRVPLGRLRRRREPLRLLAAPLVPWSREVRRPACLQLEHGRGRRLEEPAVVGDEDDGRVQVAQGLLEP